VCWHARLSTAGEINKLIILTSHPHGW